MQSLVLLLILMWRFLLVRKTSLHEIIYVFPDKKILCLEQFGEIDKMVCEKCEKKGKLGKASNDCNTLLNLVKKPFLSQVITPDPWKAGASNTTKPGGRKVGENKLLTASKNRFNPMTTEFKKCKICKVSFQCIYFTMIGHKCCIYFL